MKRNPRRKVIRFETRACAENPDFTPPTIMSVHSANPVGRKNMIAGIEAIQRNMLNRY